MTDREWLAELEWFGIKLGLDAMAALSADLGHPERACPVVHVAGTNGKGSVAVMISTALTAAGYRTGRYTSPHLVRLEERFAIDNRVVAADQLDRALATVRSAVERRTTRESPPTYFEVTTAVAFELFRAGGVDVAIVEVGLGGRHDATNIVSPVVSIITSIDFDHQAYLGTTIESIASEKAGIVKRGVPVVTGSLPPAAAAVVDAAARAAGASVTTTEADCTVVAHPGPDGAYVATFQTSRASVGPITLGLRGRHQVENAAVAVLALETLRGVGFPVAPSHVEAGLRDARWPARLDLIALGSRRLLVDGAHNPAGARALAAYLRDVYPEGLPLVLGVMADKDIAPMIASLAPHARPLILTTAPGRRAATARDLATLAEGVASEAPVLVEDDLGAALALAWSHGATVAVAGSLYLAGAVLALVGHEPE